MRIADILLMGGDDDIDGDVVIRQQRRVKEDHRSYDCLTPLSILSRWFSSKGQRTVVKGERERRREKAGGEFCCRERKDELECSTTELIGKSSPAVPEELKGDCELPQVSGCQRKEASFSLGVGFGLVYLLAASRNELDRVIELRTQMEMVLQSVKEEVQSQRTDAHSMTSCLNHNLSTSIGDAQEGLNTNAHVSLQISKQFENSADSETTMVCESRNCNTTRHEKCVEGMEQLEAELEAELERLQLHLDTEYVLTQQHQQRMEIPEATCEGCPSVSYGEVVDHPVAESKELGVPPSELERRLHELLEARQQERIKELESALERAKLKLREKEAEVSWWKDTAQIISQHVPEISHLLR